MSNVRHEVIMAGIGGKGVLLAGLVLAQAGMELYPYVIWTPTYFTLMRSGPSECTVIISQERIASPLLSLSDVVIVFEPSQLRDFEVRVRPQGVLIAESAELPEVGRKDIKVLKVPAVETAAGLGNIVAANFVILGSYIQTSQAVPPQLIEAQIDQRFQASAKLQELNRQAFRRGMELAAKAG